ncbi:MAG: spore protease YyaC [Clostridiales bacterium]|nr:spore protease YyaC [Clostridiales bacterium]
MENKSYNFSVWNEHARDGVTEALNELNPKNKKPIIICIGSDLVLGDSLGPLVGTFLRQKNLSGYIYGTLNAPITAKEISYAKTYLKLMHPSSLTIAVDAAVGSPDDVGLIKVQSGGLKPGLGVNKDLGLIGDISIIGIVAGRSQKNYDLFNLTRLNLIYKMSRIIAEGIETYLQVIDTSFKSGVI